jgi:hypothetical protein
MRPTIILLLFFGFSSCRINLEKAYNLNHINHLYEPIQAGEKKLGTVWIYCEAPDYKHVADEDEGFTCVDDVARALVLLSREYERRADPELLHKIMEMTEFLLFMQADNGYFYNFLFYDKSINKTHINSVATASFWTMRAAWALSEVLLLEDSKLLDLRRRCKEALDKLWARLPEHCFQDTSTVNISGFILPSCIANTGSDQASVLLLALDNYYLRYPSPEIREWIVRIGNQILAMQRGPHESFLSWQNIWHAWGNTQSYALLRAGKTISHQPFVDAALREVENFYPYVVRNQFLQAMTLNGDSDTVKIGSSETFPQIAYNISPMIMASIEAYSITGNAEYAHQAAALASWFWGNNPARTKMYDAESGRTFDGITGETYINRNSGAESTIEALLSLQALRQFPELSKMLHKKIK